MTARNPTPIWPLVAKAGVIGLVASTLLNLVVLFLPLPDAVIQGVVALQGVGLLFEIWRATPYHMSAWRPLLVNAALYAGIVLAVLLIRRRRKARFSVRAV